MLTCILQYIEHVLCVDVVQPKFQNMFWHCNNNPEQCFEIGTVVNKHFYMNYVVQWGHTVALLFEALCH
jgi:hypothetical protein